MNKLGFYVENTTVPFLRDAFSKVKPPVLLVHAQDRGLLREIRNTLSPDTFIIGRIFVDLPQQNAWLTSGDPEGAGRGFAERIINYDFGFAKEKGSNGRLLFDAWMSLNEPVRGPASFADGKPDAETLARYEALDRLQAAFLERLRADGLEGVAFSFAAGNFTAKNHVVQYFPRSLAAYTYLAFHEYGWPNLMPRADTSTAALTYRALAEGIRERYGNRHKLIITEAGLARMYRHPNDPAGDVGWLYPGETISEPQYWESLQWYNAQMAQDDYAMGACLFQVGHAGRWETFRHLGTNNQGQPILLIDKIATLRDTAQPAPTPAPTPVPTPAPTPPPAATDERGRLLQRVQAVQAAMQAAVKTADAFTADLAAARSSVTQAVQGAASAPTAQEVQGLLDRLNELDAALNGLPPGSTVNAAQVRGQVANLRQQVTVLLAQAQAFAGTRTNVTAAQSRLAASDGQTAGVSKTKQSATQVLGQANTLQSDLQAAGAAVARDLEGLLASEASGVRDISAALTAIVSVPGEARSLSNVRRVVIHHTGMAADLGAEDVVRRLARDGRQGLPFHYLVTGAGLSYQLAPLDIAVNQSRVAAVDADAVGVAFGGDFDLAVPSGAQMAAAADLLATLLGELGLHVNDIYGRNELERGTTSPGMQWSQGVRWRDDLVARVADLTPALP